jgi:hypothetical protein
MNRRIDDFQSQHSPRPAPPKYHPLDYIRWAIGKSYRENNRLRDLNADLNSQLTRMRSADYVTKEERETLNNIAITNRQLLEEQNKVILWLRNHNPTVFTHERYAGMSFSQMIIHMLGGKSE